MSDMSRVGSTGYESSVSSNGSVSDENDRGLDQAMADVAVSDKTMAGSSKKIPAQSVSKSSGPTKLERQILDEDVVGTKITTTQQLLYPKCTPDWQLIKPEHFEKIATPVNWESDLIKLQECIGVIFKDTTLLKIALTHHGCLHTNVVPDDVPVVRLSNRSLEFLGDSLLGTAAASTLFQTKPWYQEGQLSRAKSALVNNATLAKISGDLGISDVLLWPPFFTANAVPDDDKGRTTIAAGAVESLIAAVYLDQGMVAAMEFLASHVLPLATKYAVTWDPVVELQCLQSRSSRIQPRCQDISHPQTLVQHSQWSFSCRKRAQASSYKLAKGLAAEDAYALFKESLGTPAGLPEKYSSDWPRKLK